MYILELGVAFDLTEFFEAVNAKDTLIGTLDLEWYLGSDKHFIFLFSLPSTSASDYSHFIYILLI